jgi:2-iminobutanoate/2-iminopropanoate deaminase
MENVMRLPLLATLVATGFATAAAANEVISTENAPAAIGPYSQGIMAGDTLYLAGQIAIDPATGELTPGTIEEETTLVLNNLSAVLEAAGMSLANVVSTTVFMADLNEFGAMNEVYATFFPENPPARATVQAARLPRDVKIEIAAIAVR